MHSLKHGKTEIVKLLINYSIENNIKLKLLRAIKKNNIDVVKMLINYTKYYFKFKYKGLL